MSHPMEIGFKDDVIDQMRAMLRYVPVNSTYAEGVRACIAIVDAEARKTELQSEADPAAPPTCGCGCGATVGCDAPPRTVPTCDVPGCKVVPFLICSCSRCEREGDDPSDRFYACTTKDHAFKVSAKHRRIHGTPAEWSRAIGRK